MRESEDPGKYQVNNDETVQGQVIGDNPIVHQHFYATEDKAAPSTKPEHVWNVPYLRNGLGQQVPVHTHHRLSPVRLSRRTVLITGAIGVCVCIFLLAFFYIEKRDAFFRSPELSTSCQKAREQTETGITKNYNFIVSQGCILIINSHMGSIQGRGSWTSGRVIALPAGAYSFTLTDGAYDIVPIASAEDVFCYDVTAIYKKRHIIPTQEPLEGAGWKCPLPPPD